MFRLDEGVHDELFGDRNMQAAATKMKSLRDVPVAEWDNCAICGFQLVTFPEVDGVVRGVFSGQCFSAFTDSGFKPTVVYSDAWPVDIALGVPEPWFPLVASQLHRDEHPNIWKIRHPSLPASFSDVLDGSELEELAFGPFAYSENEPDEKFQTASKPASEARSPSPAPASEEPTAIEPADPKMENDTTPNESTERSIPDRLAVLKQLRESGYISDDEYQTARARLIDSI